MGPPLLDAEIDVVSESPGIHSANPPGVVSTLSSVGPFTLQLIAWKWQGSKDNYTNLQNTTATYFC